MVVIDHILEIFCATCKRNITVKEISTGFHTGHEFGSAERTAILYVREHLSGMQSAA
jgi:hypothetical protein